MLKILRDTKVRLQGRRYVNYFKSRRYSYETGAKNIPDNADVVIVGGGIAGCNTLYQLSKRGVNAVLLEKTKLTSGTTWHSAGLVWSLRPNDLEIQLLADSRSVYSDLKNEVEDFGGWTNTGGLFISRSKIRTQEYLRLHTAGKAFGIESHMLDPNEAQKLFPLLDPTVFKAALHSPADGTVDPDMTCNALIKVAKANGGKVIEGVNVYDIEYDINDLGNKEVRGVRTGGGVINTKCVVNCGGVWGPKVARFAGVPSLPLIPFKHAYVISDTIPEIRGCPIIRDHDVNLYLKPHGESLHIGGYEPNPHMLDEVPDNFAFQLYELDWNIFGVHVESASTLCPKLAKIGIKSTVCGPESFTPDHKPLLGEDPQVFGLYHNCGYNSAGVMFSAGCAIQMADWVTSGRPSYAMFPFDIRRFTAAQWSRGHWARESAHEAYVRNYYLVFPHDQPLAGRDVSHDALHHRLVAEGAVMETRAGWERPALYLKGEVVRVPRYDWGGTHDHPRNDDLRYEDFLAGDYTYGFSKHHIIIGEEALACRNAAGLVNLSYFGKYYLTGPDARRTAQLAFTADLEQNGKVAYSCMLNEKGGVEADLTVSVMDGGSGQMHEPIFKGRGYYIVASGFSANHTLSHLRKIINTHKLRATLSDVSKQMCILSVQGPQSQSILQRYTNAGLSNDAFPTNTHKGIHLAVDGQRITCRALRVGWSGELGWELHVPSSKVIHVYNDLSKNSGLRNVGWRALTSLAAEKGYHLWNSDLRSDDNPVEANLGFVCRKDGEYIGNEHVTKALREGVTKKYAFFTLDDKVALLGNEAIYRDGHCVGHLRRGDYAYYLDKPIGIGYVRNADKSAKVSNDFLKKGSYEIEVLGKKYKADLHLRSPFDPKGLRILGNYGCVTENQYEPHSGQNERAGGSE